MLNEKNWFMNYYCEEINKTELIKKYINTLNNKTNEKNIEYKINQIEKDYQKKFNDIEILCKSPNELSKIKLKSSLIILQKELDIIKILSKYILQNKIINYNLFLSCLKLLFNLSETLRIRLGQKEFNHDKTINNNISRCSYKFCSYNDNCIYNYTNKTKKLCYHDHYVHNMVSSDLKILIDYIQKNYNTDNIVLHNKDIFKTINTLNFVIAHMETELKAKCLYLPEIEWEKNHFLKNK